MLWVNPRPGICNVGQPNSKGFVMQQMEIQARAGSEYAELGRKLDVNRQSVKLETEFGPVVLQVNIKGYSSNGQSVPSTYFDHRSNVNFSIRFTFTPNIDISGSELLWGNDFDSPIRDLLPWGFSAAFAAFKRLVDPSVEGDVYADKPYLYGPCLTSINYITHASIQDQHASKTPQPDIDLDSEESTSDAAARQKKYLNPEERKEYIFHAGDTYTFDFCTPYLELSTQLAVKLPGFTFDVGKYAGRTQLRYVLKVGEKLVFKVTFDASSATSSATSSVEPSSDDGPSTKAGPEPTSPSTSTPTTNTID